MVVTTNDTDTTSVTATRIPFIRFCGWILRATVAMKCCSLMWLLCSLVAATRSVARVDAAAFLVPQVARSVHALQSQQQQGQDQERKPCFYRAPDTDRWHPRINIDDLKVGQHLNGTVVQELLEAKTGPKNARGEWQICNGMLRLGRARMAVARKRATRLRRKDYVEVVVSRIYPESARFEVVLLDTPIMEERPPLISASTLKPKAELAGTVTRIQPYGVFVNVGANREGLLHIQKVANLYQRYIDKENGLEGAGLERGARIRVQVLSNDRKRLFLDFPDDVKDAAQAEVEHAQLQKGAEEMMVMAKIDPQEPSSGSAASSVDDSDNIMSEEEAAAWIAYAELGRGAQDDDVDEEEEDVDEDRDIEDALGLGMY